MSNLFKVVSAHDLDEILHNNHDKITIVGFMQEWVDNCKIHKGYFKQCAKSHRDCFFVLIDIANFNTLSFDIYKLKVSNLILNNEYHSILIKTFNNATRALDYYNTIIHEESITKYSETLQFGLISSNNYVHLYKNKDLDNYLEFFNKNYIK